MSGLRITYLIISFLALVSCWYFNINHLMLGRDLWMFVSDNFVNNASASIAVDISWMFAAAAVWMVVEAKKLQIPHVWLYILFGFIIAISVTFPLFLFVRQGKLEASTKY